MFIHANKITWLVIFLCIAGSADAQEKNDSLSQGSKEAVDRLKATPNAVGKTLQALGNSVSAKLGLSEVTTTKVRTDVAVTPILDKQSEQAQPHKALIIGKRDPFRPFTLNTGKTGRPPPKNLSPLERYELGQLKLVGVIWDVKQPNAIVEDAAGLGYVVKTGTPIGSNEGKIKRIQPSGLLIEEFETDVFGTKRRIERNMRLTTEKAE